MAARELLRQFAFAYVTGNGEAHAKNFPVVDVDGEWRVSPADDVPSTYPYGDTTLAIDINGKRDESVGRSDFVELGEHVGVRAKAVASMLDELVARSATWIDDIEQLSFDGHVRHKLRRSIEYQMARLRP